MRDWLSHRVAASPDTTALVRASDGEAWSYADLDRLVAETAGRLAAVGIDANDHLGVLLSPCVGYVGLAHAAMRLGATLVPFGDDLTPRELAARVEQADLDALVCGEETEADAVETLGRLDERNSDEATESAALPDLFSVDSPDNEAVDAVHENDPVALDEPKWGTDDRLCILFTSGTTGDPKPVELTAGNVLSSAIASAFRLGIDPADSWLVTLSLHHMGGLAPVYRSALYGTNIVLREEFDPGAAADDIDRYDVTGVSLVPTMLERMLDSRGTLADSLRVVLLGGAPATDELIERCENYSIPVFPTYGMTETASQVATARPRDAFDRVGTVGRPIFWTDLIVVSEDGTPVAPGETGELVVDGPTVTPGYYGNPEATSEAFNEYGLHTGDIGYVDEDRYVYVLNRRDDRIITGGENVQPGEVATVLREHPNVEDAAVVGIEDEEWGERVAALIVPAADVDDRRLLAFADDRLAGFKLPRTLGYAEELPRTLSGTVERDDVREQLRNVGFEPERPSEDFETAGFEPASLEPTEPEEASDDSPSDDGFGGRSEDDTDAESEDTGSEGDGTDADVSDDGDTDIRDHADGNDDGVASEDGNVANDGNDANDGNVANDANDANDDGNASENDENGVEDSEDEPTNGSSSNDSPNGAPPSDTPSGEDA